MGINYLFQMESETVIEKPFSIPFDFSDTTNIPQGKEVGDKLVITPITVRTWFELKPYLLAIEKEDYDKLIERKGIVIPDAEVVDIIQKYDSLLLDIICIGLHNSNSERPEWFREVLKDNSTWKDIYILFNAILFRIGNTPFCNSITIARNVSPLTEAELIAAQKNLESWTNQPACSLSS